MTLNVEEPNQEQIGVRLDLIPPAVILEIGRVLHVAALKYGAKNHKTIKVSSHLNHALTHIFKYMEGDETEPHLSHAATRLILAMDVDGINKR